MNFIFNRNLIIAKFDTTDQERLDDSETPGTTAALRRIHHLRRELTYARRAHNNAVVITTWSISARLYKYTCVICT